MRRQPGIVVVDANALSVLESDEAQARLRSNLRVADLEVWPSAINVLEAMRTENPSVRNRLLATIHTLAEGRSLLPWPFEVLRRVGLGVLADADSVDLGDRQLDWVLANSAALSDHHVQQAKDFLEQRESEFNEMHDQARRRLQPALRSIGLLKRWSTVAEFLDQQWMKPELLGNLVDEAWEAVGLPAPAPLEKVLADDAWRLFWEGFGAAAFERGASSKQPRRVQEADLLQLVYLGGAQRRIIVTEDAGLLRVAKQILHGRHQNARAVLPHEMIE